MLEVLRSKGVLFTPGDDNTLGSYILELVNNPEERRNLSHYEFERVVSMFSEKQFIDRTLEIYRHLMNPDNQEE